ncbi:high-affinity choline transporter BetT, partial [bacterium LRH843]|nr:high-affinity choline transporter BetT [bacterium LRH843]
VGNVDILNWKKRLSRVMHHPGTTDTRRMLDDICRPAVMAVAEEMQKRGIDISVQESALEEDPNLYHLDLMIHLEEEQNFV